MNYMKGILLDVQNNIIRKHPFIAHFFIYYTYIEGCFKNILRNLSQTSNISHENITNIISKTVRLQCI